MEFKLTSTAFVHKQPIPRKYTCDGENISPPLAWGEPPHNTMSFALIIDDPDAPAGTWIHWIIYNIPAAVHLLSEGIPTVPSLKDGSRQGNNSARRSGYTGPCPPGGTHRYFFKLYALDRMFDLPDGVNKEMLLKTIQGHTLGEAILMGTYQR